MSAAGCLAASTMSKPISLGTTIAVLMVNCAESVNICFLFPFMAFMLEDFGYTGHRLGYYCGGLAASFCTGQFCSSVLWGFLSDKYGRKPTLVIGTLGTAVGTAIFGFSRSYPQAICGRIVSGLLSGNLGILKTYLTEITDDSNRTKAFAILQTSGSIGNIIGPLIGGMLASPALKYPSLFARGSIWDEYPYLFPCLLCVINSIVASFMCFLFLKETRVFSSAGNNASSSAVKNPVKSTMDSSSHPMMDDSSAHSEARRDGDSDNPAKPALTYVIVDEDEDEENPDEESGQVIKAAGDADEASPPYSFDNADRPGGTKAHSGERVLREKVVLLTTGAYGLLAFSYIIIDETLPLFMKLDTSHGGLSFRSSEIGFILSLSGAVMLLFNILILPTLGGYSKLWLYKATNLVAIPFTLAWPTAGLINEYMVAHGHWQRKSVVMYGMLLVTSSIKNSLAVMTFTAIIILVNHSVPSRYLGKVNGLGQSFAALARALGPALGGVLWSISMKNDFVWLNFIFASSMLAIGQCIVQLLPERLDRKRGDEEGPGGVEMGQIATH